MYISEHFADILIDVVFKFSSGQLALFKNVLNSAQMLAVKIYILFKFQYWWKWS